jgi:hypothetical protein
MSALFYIKNVLVQLVKIISSSIKHVLHLCINDFDDNKTLVNLINMSKA